jgi:hypothetical protein
VEFNYLNDVSSIINDIDPIWQYVNKMRQFNKEKTKSIGKTSHPTS